jgi:hypothetical protein
MPALQRVNLLPNNPESYFLGLSTFVSHVCFPLRSLLHTGKSVI